MASGAIAGAGMETGKLKIGKFKLKTFVLAAANLSALLLLASDVFGQKVVEGTKLKFPEYYEPPHEKQLKSLLAGAKVEPQPDGFYLVTEAKIQTFREDGSAEMLVTAPQCVVDSGQRVVSSPGLLRVQTAEGSFSIEGEGFLYRQTNSDLIISNRVHTTIQPDLLGSKPAKATPSASSQAPKGIEVFSDYFEYAANSGAGIYRQNVRVAGTNLGLTCGLLTVVLPMKERRLQTITAETNVVMEYEKIQATGERAVYATDTELARITGHPTWRAEQGEGRGDELIIDRTEKTFLANGQAYFKMPARSTGPSTFLARPNPGGTNRPPATNEFVEILSDNYEFRTNVAYFREEVRVTDRAGDELKGKMSCHNMTLFYSGTNELQQMVAEDKVIIEQGDQGLSAGKAVYDGTNGILELTENPSWRAGVREGKGDRLLVDTRHDGLSARGNGFMRLPARELGQTGPSGPQPSKARTLQTATNQFAEVSADDYDLNPKSALFRGHVRINHPRMKWACEKMTAQLPGEGELGHSIVAEQAVVFDLIDQEGQQTKKVHGKGEKAVYTYSVSGLATNDVVELSGHPVLETPQGTIENSLIILDRAHNRLMAPGRYRIYGSALPDVRGAFPSLKP